MKISFYTLCICLFITTKLQAQQWNEVGPIDFPTNSSGQINGLGRVTQLKFHPNLANKLYATSASGGLYTSIDTGHHWFPMGTDVIPTVNMSSVCIDFTNDQIIYVSTGDPNYYSTDVGLYKTTNGGGTWNQINTGLSNNMAVEILMDPSNNQKLIIATNNGIFQSNDAGNTWINVKNGGAFTDMKQIPNTNILVAVTKTSQVWRSTDFGNSWIQITSMSFAQAGADGMRIAVNKVSNNILYIVSNGGNGVVFKSNDLGLTYTNIYSSSTQCLVCYDEDPINAGQGDYDFAALCDPLDPNHLYVAAHCLWVSIDGGITWNRRTAWPQELHTDHHQFEFSPYDNSKLWSANDGGLWLREGLNDSLWQPMCDGLSAMEIYQAAASPVVRKLYSAGTQDNGEVYHDFTGWFTNRGGDWNNRVAFDYTPLNNVYYITQGERRSFTPNGTQTFNSPAPNNIAQIAFCKKKPNVSLMAGNNVWLSENIETNSPTWNQIYTNTSTVKDIVISTADSSVAYLMTASKIVRLDNYLSSSLTTAASTIPSSASVRGSLATVKNNANIVYASCNAKVFRSDNQGGAWTNITYNLPTTNILKIYHDDYSSNEQIYVCSGNQIFTKTINDTTWQNISYNLPKIANINSFMLFNDSTIASKLLVSYYGRGMWEYQLHPTFPPIADFKAGNTIICPNDSIQFANLSVENNLSYSWNFQGATPSTSNVKDPKVLYTTAGNYNVSLTVTSPNGTHVKSENAYIQVLSNTPTVDDNPGRALSLSGASTSYLNAGKLNLNSNHVTMTCWIKPQGIQNDWGGLVFCRGGNTTCGISIKSDNEIRYHWNGSGWGNATNVYVNDNEWSHCALVIEPTQTTIYVNGNAWTIQTSNATEAFDADLVFGADFNSGARRFKGLMDEVCIYNRALSQNEIREQMHLTKLNTIPSDSLVGYWQMNEITSNNTILNKANCANQAKINSSSSLVNSTAPIGKGTSERFNVLSSASLSSLVSDVQMNFSSTGTLPDGEICISHLQVAPDEMPAMLPSSGNYWIVDNYGANTVFGNLEKIIFSKVGYLTGNASDYKLYQRGANADSTTWSAALCNASSMMIGNNGSLTFTANTNVNQFGQFVLSGPFTPLSNQIIETSEFEIYPNPSHDYIQITHNTESEFSFILFGLDGKKLMERSTKKGKMTIDIGSLSNGIYFYQVNKDGKMKNGKIEVLH